MSKIRIALCQMNIHYGDIELNQFTAAEYIKQASQDNCQIALLPELWSTGYDLSHASQLAQPLDKGYFQFLARLAVQSNMYIGGSALELYQDQIFNTFVLYSPDGELVGKYQKVHLFSLMHENQWLAAGNGLTCINTPFGKIGLAICYDLRFPEIFRKYALQGVRLVLLPAEWPITRQNHWQILTQARAIENQIALAGTNCTGNTGGEPFAGDSILVDAGGNILTEAGIVPGISVGEIDLEFANQVRKQIDILNDRRPEVYS